MSGRSPVYCLFLVVASAVSAQVATSPGLTSPTAPDISSQSSATSSPPLLSSQPQEVSPEFRRLHYQLNLDLRGVYDDNVGLGSQDKISDYYTRVDPAISVGFGDLEPGGANYLRAEYDPDLVFFADHSQFNSYQHVFILGGQSQFSRLTLGLTENAQFLKGFDVNQALSTGSFVNSVNLDVRGRPELKTFNTQLTASYDVGGKTSLSTGAQSLVTDYSQFTSSETLSGNLYVNYALGPKVTVGAGGVGGRQFVDQPSPDQTFEQVNVRASYIVTDKISFSGSAGVEFRQFDSGRGTHSSPIFQLDLNYTPADGSALIFSGSRRITNSASVANQDFAATELVASGSQRFFQRFFLRLTGGYQNLTYFGSASASGASRDDNYYFLQPGIDVKITRFLYVGAYYLLRRDDSSVSGLSFDENQAGARATFTF
jgi:Putative beta-barrel porin 2